MNELPLRDIHLPDAVSWWPLAIGWWLLPVLIIALVFAAIKIKQYRQQHKKAPYRKLALAEFNHLKASFKDDDEPVQKLRAISALLRRIALSYLPREEVASLTGQHWIARLNKLSPEQAFNDEVAQLLEHAAYQQSTTFDQAALLKACEQWIKALPKTRSEALS